MTCFVRGLLFPLLFVAFFVGRLSAQDSAPAPLPFVEAGPPNSNNGIAFRELFEQPDQWVRTRAKTNELLYADWAFKQFSDDDLRKWFAQMGAWNLKLELEVGAIKEWGRTGDVAFQKERGNWDRIVRLGGRVDSVAMDEPLACVRSRLKESDDYAVEETAKFIAAVRQNFPQTAVVEIEPYPFVGLDDQKKWIDALQRKLAERGVRGLDGYRLDVDWIAFTLQQKGSWKEVKELEDYCRKLHLPFSLVYWASGYDLFVKRLKIGDDATWYDRVMQQGYDYAAVGGKPDQYCVESWVGAPARGVPETDRAAFTRSVIDLYDKIVDPPVVPAQP